MSKMVRAAAEKEWMNSSNVIPIIGCSLFTCEAFSDATEFYATYGFDYAKPPSKTSVTNMFWKPDPASSPYTIIIRLIPAP
jgi:hypothetical protein